MGGNLIKPPQLLHLKSECGVQYLNYETVRFVIATGILGAFVKWGIVPITKATFEGLLRLCKDNVKKVIDEIYSKEIEANFQARGHAAEALERAKTNEQLTSGLVQSVQQLSTMPELVRSLNTTLTDMHTEMSEWRGALKQSGVIKI